MPKINKTVCGQLKLAKVPPLHAARAERALVMRLGGRCGREPPPVKVVNEPQIKLHNFHRDQLKGKLAKLPLHFARHSPLQLVTDRRERGGNITAARNGLVSAELFKLFSIQYNILEYPPKEFGEIIPCRQQAAAATATQRDQTKQSKSYFMYRMPFELAMKRPKLRATKRRYPVYYGSLEL